MSVSVEDLLDLALPAGTEIVAGRAGLGRQVVWARTLRPRPPAFESIDGGEMAILSSDQLGMLEGVTLVSVVARLADAGVSAIAVLGKIEAAAADAAEARGVPLISLPAGVSTTEVERAAIAAIVDRQAELQRRASEIYRQLSQLVLEEKGLQAIAERLAAICGKAVMLEDDACRLRFSAPSEDVPSPEDVDLSRTSAAVSEWARSTTVSSSQPPVKRFDLQGTGLARLVSPVASRDGLAGFISVVAPAESLKELDKLAVSRAAAVCAMEVAKAAAVEEAEARVRGDLLDQLLSTGLQNDQVALGKARRLGYDPSVPSVVMAFRAFAGGARSQVVAKPAERSRSLLESAVRLALSRQEARCLVAARGASVIAVVPVAEVRGLAAVRDVAESVRRSAESALAGFRVGVGVGRRTGADGSFEASYREAEEALGVGFRMNGESSATFFEELGVVRLLAKVDRQAELEEFYQEYLGKLEAHDLKSGGGLVATLEMLFRCHGNLSRAADQLALHRNSLLYRLERIRDITGLDMDDPEVRLSMQVALKARQLLEGLRGRPGS